MRTLLRPFLLLAVVSVALGAQGDTTMRQGVSLVLNYVPGTRPGIAVLPVRGANGDSVRAIIQRDLDFGDRVQIIGTNPDDLPPVSGTPNYELFERLMVAGIVQVTVTPDGLNINVHDVKARQSARVIGVALAGAALSREWRMSVHEASDLVEQWATGTRGIAATRIAFVRDRKIWVVDSDGAMPTVVAAEGAMSPAWHPSGKSIAYALLPDAGSAIVVRDLVSGSARRVTPPRSSGTYAAPAFSPDGRTLAYAFGSDRGTEIYAVDLVAGGAPRALTTGGFDNTSPSFSPDGHQITFMSGRLGRPEVYIADADGSNAEPLIVTAVGDQEYRESPAWSPDGRLLAFSSRIDGQYQLLTSSPNGRAVARLTNVSQNEDPAWAPDGRHIVFTSERGGGRQLWVVDTASGRFRQLTHGSGAKGGAWSPSLATQR
jgi:TolB protein